MCPVLSVSMEIPSKFYLNTQVVGTHQNLTYFIFTGAPLLLHGGHAMFCFKERKNGGAPLPVRTTPVAKSHLIKISRLCGNLFRGKSPGGPQRHNTTIPYCSSVCLSIFLVTTTVLTFALHRWFSLPPAPPPPSPTHRRLDFMTPRYTPRLQLRPPVRHQGLPHEHVDPLDSDRRRSGF